MAACEDNKEEKTIFDSLLFPFGVDIFLHAYACWLFTEHMKCPLERDLYMHKIRLDSSDQGGSGGRKEGFKDTVEILLKGLNNGKKS